MSSHTFSNINDLITALSHFAWPVLVLIIFLSMRQELVKIFPRVRKWSLMGNEVEVEPLSPGEIAEKNKAEIKEIKAAEDLGNLNIPVVDKVIDSKDSIVSQEVMEQKSRKISESEFFKLIPRAEEAALGKVETNIGFPIQRHVRAGDYMFDAFGTNSKGRPYFFEVKVYPSVEDKDGRLQIQRILYQVSVIAPRLIDAVKKTAHELYPRTVPTLMIVLVLNTRQNLGDVIVELTRYKAILHTLEPRVSVKFTFLNLPKLLEE